MLYQSFDEPNGQYLLCVGCHAVLRHTPGQLWVCSTYVFIRYVVLVRVDETLLLLLRNVQCINAVERANFSALKIGLESVR